MTHIKSRPGIMYGTGLGGLQQVRAVPKARTFPAPDETDQTWREQAECRGAADPDLWFPLGNTGPALLQIEDAKAVCRRCDVVDQCLQWALESGQDAGVWGGMSEDERRALKRRKARKQLKRESGA